MKKIGRILSLIVCFQLAWGCQSNDAPVSGSSSGPSSGYTEISGSVTLAFIKISEVLIPSAAAADLAFRAKSLASKSSGFSAEGMSSTILESCNQEEVAVEAVDRVSAAEVKVGAEEEAKKVARLVDYSDLSSPCLIKEIELNLSADGETATYNVQIENELVEDKVVALVYGDEEKGVYKNAIFSIEKGDRVIKQHLDDESSVKAELLGTQIQSEIGDAEFTDDVKFQMRDRIKELKKIEDFGLDLLGDKEKMISLLKDPSFKDNMIAALIDARKVKESEGDNDANSVSDIYSQIISIGASAANTDESLDSDSEKPRFELKEFIKMNCSPDHVFIAKHGRKEYILQITSSNTPVLEKLVSGWGNKVENGKSSFKPISEGGDLNGILGKIFWIARDLVRELKSNVNFKVIISDPEKKEPDQSCAMTIAPPTFNFSAIEKFDYKSYGHYNEALFAFENLLKKLQESLNNKFLVNDGQISDEENNSMAEQLEKSEEIIHKVREKMDAYFKSIFASKGLVFNLKPMTGFNFKEFKTLDEALIAHKMLWSKLVEDFESRIKRSLESKDINEDEASQIRQVGYSQGKELNSKIYFAIHDYFHALNVKKEIGVDSKSFLMFSFDEFENFDDARVAFEDYRNKAESDYKQMMEVKLKEGKLTPEEFDMILNQELNYLNQLYWKMYNEIYQHFNR